MLASEDGKIVFENTLDTRLDVAFRQKLPEVWYYYFVLLQQHLRTSSTSIGLWFL